MAYFHILYLLLILFFSLLMLVHADFGKLIRVLPSFWRNSQGAASAIPRPNALSLVFTPILIKPPNRELYRHKNSPNSETPFHYQKHHSADGKFRLPLSETFCCWLIHQLASRIAEASPFFTRAKTAVISQARIGIAPILAPSTLPLSPDHPTGAAARIHERRATLRTPEPPHRSSARPATPGSGSRLLRARVGIRRQWRTDTVWPRRAIESVL